MLAFPTSFELDDRAEEAPFGGTGGGTADFREAALLVAVEAEDTVDTTEDRADEVEVDRFATAGESFLLSTGDGGGRLTVVEVVDAADCTLVRITLGEDVVAVDLTLVVDTLETTRDRAAELGVTSDFAVSKFVEPSLVDDMVELGRERPDGGRRVDGPATVLRMVDACDRVDLVDAADDRSRGDRETSLVDAVEDRCRRGAGEDLAAGVETDAGSRGERIELAKEVDECPGVSLESGRTLVTLSVRRVAVVARDAVGCVLRATDLTEAADDLTGSFASLELFRMTGAGLNECMLVESSSPRSL